MPKPPAKKDEQLLHHVSVEAYSKKTERLAYTLALPPLTEAWVRALLNVSRRKRVEGMWPLAQRQLKTIQELVEPRLEPRRFCYFLDGSSVVLPTHAAARSAMKKRSAS